MEEQKDNINPDHYKNQTSLECIEAMEIIFGRDAVIDFCRCNAWKYIWRWKNKNGVEDLDKAKWYLERAYNMLDDLDKRMDIVRGMIHYVRTETSLAEEMKSFKKGEVEPESDYENAFKIACALLNGDALYGVDSNTIFSEIMKEDGCICSVDYENYILTHLNTLMYGEEKDG